MSTRTEEWFSIYIKGGESELQKAQDALRRGRIECHVRGWGRERAATSAGKPRAQVRVRHSQLERAQDVLAKAGVNCSSCSPIGRIGPGESELEGWMIGTVEAREQFSEVINRAAYGRERVILTRRGKPLVAMVPVEDVELLQELENRADLDALREVREEMKREGTVPWTQVKKELGLD